ncbi:MAG TPA: MltA domain-containing protein [Candidatus Methanoperedens sp.]|nr:MltA domain-containing protein [Candidatus Methanoperedens sp.]
MTPRVALGARATAALGLALAVAAGCAAPRIPAGLVPVPSARIAAPRLVDDAGFIGLGEALRQSLRYYRRLPAETTFSYGELTYTSREMEASTALFLQIIETTEGEARLASIREQFLLFESRNDRGAAFFTGYFEPILPGSLTQSERFRAPLYAIPADLVTIDLTPYADAGMVPAELRGRSLRGKSEGRRIVPYDDRDRISFGDALAGRAEPVAWVADEVELFFLQIQGSGLIRLEDGSLLRVNYADQNGHPYRAIGRLLRDRIPPERMSLQALKEWLRANPAQVREVLDYNPSYTFFRRVEEGPLGNIQVPLTPGRSLAADARLVPKGGVAWFETALPAAATPGGAGPVPVRRFGVVQDTGGAITGHGRADIFWGTGDEAEQVAGPFKEPGRLFLLVARKECLPVAAPRP